MASPSPSQTAVLCCGTSGPEVVDLQTRLRRLGLYDGRVDGEYSRRLADAVASYQRRRGIRTDPPGSYGPATREALLREDPDAAVY
ncbi:MULTISPECIES: peptidoglycan-binding protein [unclassified Streptomyces]|uniref:peptidoglycan-binding domain-containing protein n=1 Tax=unclassified Streptomyces TaxID=2593676 RepID=UPI0038303784